MHIITKKTSPDKSTARQYENRLAYMGKIARATQTGNLAFFSSTRSKRARETTIRGETRRINTATVAAVAATTSWKQTRRSGPREYVSEVYPASAESAMSLRPDSCARVSNLNFRQARVHAHTVVVFRGREREREMWCFRTRVVSFREVSRVMKFFIVVGGGRLLSVSDRTEVCSTCVSWVR